MSRLRRRLLSLLSSPVLAMAAVPLSILLVVAVTPAMPASAQLPGAAGPYAGGNATLATTTTTANVALPASTAVFPYLQVINDGTVTAFYAAGIAGVTATTASLPVLAGHCAVLALPFGAAALAGIVSTGTTTLRLVQWSSQPSGC